MRLLNSLTRDKWKDVSQAPSIADLQVPAEVGVDPFNGEPLHIKKLPEGWLVYSVGPNLQDDGGNLSDEDAFDRGLGPPPPKAVRSAVDDDKSSTGSGNSSSR